MKRLRLWLTIVTLFWAVAAGAQTTSEYDVLLQEGKAQLQAGSADLALSSGESATKMNADRWEAYALAGGALMNMKRYEEAADKLSEAIKRAPEAKQAALRDLRRQCLVTEPGPAPAAKQSNPAATTQAEIVLWKSIENSGNPDDLEAYLKQFPAGAFAPLANARLEKLNWERIQNGKNPSDFTDFLRRFPEGKHSALAGVRLHELEDRALSCGNRKGFNEAGSDPLSLQSALRCIEETLSAEGPIVTTLQIHGDNDKSDLSRQLMLESTEVHGDSATCTIRYSLSTSIVGKLDNKNVRSVPRPPETKTIALTEVKDISVKSTNDVCRHETNSVLTCSYNPDFFKLIVHDRSRSYIAFNFHNEDNAHIVAQAMIRAAGRCERNP
jgi:hypothetical protein